MLTGETGAGKSIMVDALTLVSGARAAADQIRAGAERAEIAATFDIRQLPTRAARHCWKSSPSRPKTNCWSGASSMPDGRSRAYLNGQAVPVQQLREIVGLLLDVHGQHEFQSLVRGSCAARTAGSATASSNHSPARSRPRTRLAGAAQPAAGNRIALRDRDSRIEMLRFQDSELAALALQARRGRGAGTPKRRAWAIAAG